MTSRTYPHDRAIKALADLEALPQSGKRFVYLNAQQAILCEAPVAALRALMEYVGGWDAPKDHPCAIATRVLAIVDPDDD